MFFIHHHDTLKEGKSSKYHSFSQPGLPWVASFDDGRRTASCFDGQIPKTNYRAVSHPIMNRLLHRGVVIIINMNKKYKNIKNP